MIMCTTYPIHYKVDKDLNKVTVMILNCTSLQSLMSSLCQTHQFPEWGPIVSLLVQHLSKIHLECISILQFSKILIIIAIIWTLAILCILPAVFFTRVIEATFPGTPLVVSRICTEKLESKVMNLVYTASIMFLQVQGV